MRSRSDTALSLCSPARRHRADQLCDSLPTRPVPPSSSDLASRKPDQFKVVFTLDQPPSNWSGPTGYVNPSVVKDALKQFGTTPDKGDKVKVFVCGPPGQVKAISGPKKVSRALFERECRDDGGN